MKSYGIGRHHGLDARDEVLLVAQYFAQHEIVHGRLHDALLIDDARAVLEEAKLGLKTLALFGENIDFVLRDPSNNSVSIHSQPIFRANASKLTPYLAQLVGSLAALAPGRAE
jgi:hypothetical protein